MPNTRRPTVQTFPRPYTLVFKSSGHAYPLSQQEANNLLAEYPIVKATRNRVDLAEHNGSEGTATYIIAATLGGGPAFEVTS